MPTRLTCMTLSVPRGSERTSAQIDRVPLAGRSIVRDGDPHGGQGLSASGTLTAFRSSGGPRRQLVGSVRLGSENAPWSIEAAAVYSATCSEDPLVFETSMRRWITVPGARWSTI